VDPLELVFHLPRLQVRLGAVGWQGRDTRLCVGLTVSSFEVFTRLGSPEPEPQLVPW
jgi:hypothetical protein